MQMSEKVKIKEELEDNQRIDECATQFRTVGDTTRLKICYLLHHYPELTVTEIAELVDAPISTVSHSLTGLKKANVVQEEREGKYKKYSLKDNSLVKAIAGVLFVAVLVMGYISLTNSPIFNFSPTNPNSDQETEVAVEQATRDKFTYLSQNGNSSCSSAFRDSINTMADSERLRGSCCSPMSLHRYNEQTEGLKEYQDVTEIPPDPYDIEAGQAKRLLSYYDTALTPEEQQAYDYAMQNSDEKGPCCCKCWRWYVYGGLGKLLVKEEGFTGEQLTEIWNLSDGCGGDSDHLHA